MSGMDEAGYNPRSLVVPAGFGGDRKRFGPQFPTGAFEGAGCDLSLRERRTLGEGASSSSMATAPTPQRDWVYLVNVMGECMGAGA